MRLDAIGLVARLYPDPDNAASTPIDLALKAHDFKGAFVQLNQVRAEMSDAALWQHSFRAGSGGSDRPDIRRAMLVLCEKRALGPTSMAAVMHAPGFKQDEPAIAAVLESIPYYSAKRRVTTDDPSYIPTPRTASFNVMVDMFGGVPLNNLDRTPFPGTDRLITCQNVAPAWTDGVDSEGKFDYTQFQTAQSLQTCVPASTMDEVFVRLTRSSNLGVVPNDGFGDHLADQFRDMDAQGETCRRLDLYTSGHMMGGFQRIKHDEATGAKTYVYKAFDPSVTAGHKRVAAKDDPSRLSRLNFADVLPTPLNLILITGHEDVPLVQTARPPVGNWKADVTPHPVDDAARVLDKPWDGPISMALIDRLFTAGLGGELERLRPRIEEYLQSLPREQAVKALTAFDPFGKTTSSKMMMRGFADSLRHLFELAGKFSLSKDEALKIICPAAFHHSGLPNLLQRPHLSEVAEVYLEHALPLLPTNDDRFSLLNTPDDSGTLPLHNALRTTELDDDIVDAYLDKLGANATQDQLAGIFNAKGYALAPHLPVAKIFAHHFPGYGEVFAEQVARCGLADDPDVRDALQMAKLSAMNSQPGAAAQCREAVETLPGRDRTYRANLIHALASATAAHGESFDVKQVVSICQSGQDIVFLDRMQAEHGFLKYRRSPDRQATLKEALTAFSKESTAFWHDGEELHGFEFESSRHGRCHVQFDCAANRVENLHVRDADGKSIASIRPFARIGGFGLDAMPTAPDV
jgi:hypothetical protein